MELDSGTLVDLMNVGVADPSIAKALRQFPSFDYRDMDATGLKWCHCIQRLTREPELLDLMGRNPMGYLCARHVNGAGDIHFYRQVPDEPLSCYLVLKPNSLLWTSPRPRPFVAASTGEIDMEYLFIEAPAPVPFFLIKRPWPKVAA